MVCYGLYSTHFFHGKHEKGLEFASESLRIAESLGDVHLLCLAHKNMAVMLNAMGRFKPAQSHADEALTLYQPQTHGSLAIEYGHDVGVAAMAHRTFALWHLGYPDQAAQDVDRALRLASSLERANTVTYSHFFPGAVAAAFARDMGALEQQASRLVQLSEEHGFPQWGALGAVMLGPPMTARGNAEEAIGQMQRGFALCRSAGAEICRPIFLGFLAEAESVAGRVDAALKTIDDALTLTDETEERWHESELWRLKGVFLASLKEAAQAEACFCRAIEVARRQSARLPELRVSTALARLWRDQGRPVKARELLAPVYVWFTEGFDTSDLKDAKLLLDELASE
jgi:predicted ATPase